jgi:hypothetical protein
MALRCLSQLQHVRNLLRIPSISSSQAGLVSRYIAYARQQQGNLKLQAGARHLRPPITVTVDAPPGQERYSRTKANDAPSVPDLHAPRCRCLFDHPRKSLFAGLSRSRGRFDLETSLVYLLPWRVSEMTTRISSRKRREEFTPDLPPHLSASCNLRSAHAPCRAASGSGTACPGTS